LTTVDRAGRPHGAPVWYLYEDGAFVISTGRGSQKHKNVQANPNVCLVIDKREVPYYAAMAHGRVEIGPRLSDAKRREMAVRYLGEQLGERYVARTQGEDSVTLRLKPSRLIEFEGRAGRSVR
jgi:PPOX class probable F420-dependent enzyme